MTGTPDWEAVDLGPGVLAAFTTRAAGDVREPSTRARLAAWAGVPVAFGTQVHGAGVLVLHAAPPDDGTAGVADAYLTTDDGLAVAVAVADCVPVLLADPQARVVAAVHAGRNGLVAGVVGAAVAAMTGHGADPARIRAALGPSIAGSSYEVPAALRDELAARLPEAPATTSWGTPALDLRAGAVGELARAGVTQVARVDRDTFTDPDLFSHRRAATGRACGLVRLLPL